MPLEALEVQWTGSENPLGLKGTDELPAFISTPNCSPRRLYWHKQGSGKKQRGKDGLLLLMVCQHRALIKLPRKGHFDACPTQRGCGSTDIFLFTFILTAPSPLIIPLVVPVKILGNVCKGALFWGEEVDI